MPLKTGTTKEALAWNIRELRKTGRPLKQAIAIAYAVRRRKKKAK